MRYFAAIVATLLGACSAVGLQTTAVGQVDYCSYPNVVSALEGGLHKTPGGEGASLRDIVTVPINGLDRPANPHAQTSFVCHATLVKADGKSTPGRIVVSLTYNGPFSKINIEDITWISDAEFEKKRAETAAQSEKAARPVVEARKAIQKYCATATGLACSAYTGKVSNCPAVAINGYSILIYERKVRQAGATPRQAAEMAIHAMANSPLPPNPYDLGYIAAKASKFPDVQPPELFRDELLKQCIDAAAD